MCQSIAEGGDRCASHTSERRVALEASLHNKIVKSMSKDDQETLKNYEDSWDKSVELSRSIGGDSVPFTEDDNDTVEDKIWGNHAWNVSALKNADAQDAQFEYRVTMENMAGEPSYGDKVNYLTHTNSEFNKIDAKMTRLYDKSEGRAMTEKEQAQLDILSRTAKSMISSVKPLSKEESAKLIAENPYDKTAREAKEKHEALTKKLATHYRREHIANRVESYRIAYNNFSKTPEGKKALRKIAENEVQESVSKKFREGLSKKVNLHKFRGEHDKAVSAQQQLKMNEHVASAYEYQNKYSHVKKMMDSSQDIKKTMFLPAGRGGKSVSIQDSSKYEATMVVADSVYGREFEGETPEVRRKRVEQKLYERKGVTSVQALSTNPSIRSDFEKMSEHHGAVIDKVVNFKADKLGRKHAGQEDAQIANLRRNLFDPRT